MPEPYKPCPIFQAKPLSDALRGIHAHQLNCWKAARQARRFGALGVEAELQAQARAYRHAGILVADALGLPSPDTLRERMASAIQREDHAEVRRLMHESRFGPAEWAG